MARVSDTRGYLRSVKKLKTQGSSYLLRLVRMQVEPGHIRLSNESDISARIPTGG